MLYDSLCHQLFKSYDYEILIFLKIAHLYVLRVGLGLSVRCWTTC